MKVINAPARNDDNSKDHLPLTLAQVAAVRQFEDSDRAGQALLRPMAKSAGDPTPDCLVFLEGICRFGLMLHDDLYSVHDGQWYCRASKDDVPAPVANPLEDAWERTMAAKDKMRETLDIGAFFIPVVVFADMEPHDDILNELRGRKVRVLWGTDDLVERLIELPTPNDLYPGLSSRFIQRQIDALTQETPPSGESKAHMTLDLPDGASVVIQRVDVVNIYVAVAPGGAGDGEDFPRSDQAR